MMLKISYCFGYPKLSFIEICSTIHLRVHSENKCIIDLPNPHRLQSDIFALKDVFTLKALDIDTNQAPKMCNNY